MHILGNFWLLLISDLGFGGGRLRGIISTSLLFSNFAIIPLFQFRLVVAEELLRTEVETNRLVHCPFRSVGCEKITRTGVMREHRDSCLFRPVRCPKMWISLSCSHTGPLYTIQQHARDQHNLHLGITVLQPGLIASKMFDTSVNRSVTTPYSLFILGLSLSL